MMTYRFVRWTLEPVKRKGLIDDIVKVRFDIDSQAHQQFTPQTFLAFLRDEHTIDKRFPDVYIQVKRALTNYELQFVLDLQTGHIQSLTEKRDKATTLRQDILDNVEQSGVLDPRGARRAQQLKGQDLFSRVSSLQPFYHSIGRPSRR